MRPSATSAAAPRALPPLLTGILERIRCPACGGEIVDAAGDLRCTSCGAAYPMVEGIPRLAAHGTVETWAEAPAGAATSEEYQQQYQALVDAEAYNEAYRAKRFKRWSTARELHLLERLLAGQPRSAVLLDLPSGGGRLSERLDRHAELLVEADVGLGQLLYGKRTAPPEAARVWMTASAFHVPFADGAVDGVVCCRLSHHLPTAAERERLLVELLRAASCFVILTFFDYHSIKNLVRRLRRPLDGKPPKMTMTRAGVAAIAARHGAELVAAPVLFHVTSGHRYALLVKRDPSPGWRR